MGRFLPSVLVLIIGITALSLAASLAARDWGVALALLGSLIAQSQWWYWKRKATRFNNLINR